MVAGIANDWIKPDGSFRARRLHFGWDNVPMHRWGQSQMFRSLAFYLTEERKATLKQGRMLGPQRIERSVTQDSNSALTINSQPSTINPLKCAASRAS